MASHLLIRFPKTDLLDSSSDVRAASYAAGSVEHPARVSPGVNAVLQKAGQAMIPPNDKALAFAQGGHGTNYNTKSGHSQPLSSQTTNLIGRRVRI